MIKQNIGHFIGHSVPGLFFIMFGTWWMIRTLREYFYCKSTLDRKFRSWLFRSPRATGCRGLGAEAVTIVAMGVVGIFVELFHGIKANNLQHGTMYIFFMVPGILSLLQQGLRNLIPELDRVMYIMMALAYVVEGILFNFHLKGRDELDVLAHVLLVYTVFACAAATIWESLQRENILAALGKAYFTVLQGLWFCQMGFTLFHPFSETRGEMLLSAYVKRHYEETVNHEGIDLMVLSAVFTWHMGVVAGFFMLMAIAVSRCYPKVQEDGEYGLIHVTEKDVTYSLLAENCENNEQIESDFSTHSPPLLSA